MKYLSLILGILLLSFFAHQAQDAIDSYQAYEQLDSYNDAVIAAMFPEQKEAIKTVIYPLFPKSSKYWGYETDDIDYLNGQILLPDGIHSDTLRVVDAALLNYCNRYYEYQCDGDILDVLKASTIQVPQKNIITLQEKDERGLISVVYTQDGKEWALDYLTQHEYDSAFHNYVNYKP